MTRVHDKPGPTPSRSGAGSKGARQAPPAYGVALVDAASADLGGLPVQLSLAAPGGGAPGEIRRHAAEGVRGVGTSLPFGQTLQCAFGRHDIGHVRAHTGPSADAACRAMGAQAYATGADVAFRGAPSLHTVAHEAAHVVQQRAGVHLLGGVGQAGDTYERHADVVADAVVRGESAESLLSAHAGSPAGTSTRGVSTPAVQRSLETLGAMNDDPNLVSLDGLRARLAAPVAPALEAFLPALEAGEERYLFALGEDGKVSKAEAEGVILDARESFLVEGSRLTFLVPVGNNLWEHMAKATGTPGTVGTQYMDRWIVQLNLGFLPQVTPRVVEAMRALPVDDRTPATLMSLVTGLTYDPIPAGGMLKSGGFLGDCVLTLTPDTQLGGQKTQTVKDWVMSNYAAWEPQQMDPRHIGTHDGPVDPGGQWHWHLILPPLRKFSVNQKQAIIAKIRDVGLYRADPGILRRQQSQAASKRNLLDKQEMLDFVKYKKHKGDYAKLWRELLKARDQGKGESKWAEIEHQVKGWRDAK